MAKNAKTKTTKSSVNEKPFVLFAGRYVPRNELSDGQREAIRSLAEAREMQDVWGGGIPERAQVGA